MFIENSIIEYPKSVLSTGSWNESKFEVRESLSCCVGVIVDLGLSIKTCFVQNISSLCYKSMRQKD